MRNVVTLVLAGALAGGSLSVTAWQSATQPSGPPGAGVRQEPSAASGTATIVRTYCSGCHDGVMRSPSGVRLDRFDTTTMAANSHVWAKAFRQIQAGTMPPAGAPRPARQDTAQLLTSIETALGAGAPSPTNATSRRIAERLALLLWNSAPDASLMADAMRDRLTARPLLERHVARMLRDDRARAFVTRFFFPWLGLDQLASAEPDAAHFPDFDPTLLEAMATETELFILDQLRADRDPIELWNTHETFLNEQLARHYGVRGISGPHFRRVRLSAPERAGLLGQGSVLTVTSRHQHGADAAYTSPAKRALWVRWHFLGAPPPQPFPGAQPVSPESPITPQTRALPANPCGNCHRNFFPLGYALENFDPIGRWRTRDQAGAVDATGAFVDGTPTNGVAELRRVLLQRPDAFRTTITEKLLIYASGQPVDALRPAPPATLIRARQILRGRSSTRWSSIIAAVVSTRQPGE